jgi:hypothetical protein
MLLTAVPLTAVPLTAVPLSAVPLSAGPTPPAARDRVVDLAARRAATGAAVRAAAAAPVRHLPVALLEALQGSWGTPEELRGLRGARVRLASAR